MISLGCIVLQSTKPAVVGYRLPLAEEQEQQLQAQSGRSARCALPLDDWRNSYGCDKQVTVHHYMGREVLWKDYTHFVCIVCGSQREELSGRWTGLRATINDEWCGSTLSREKNGRPILAGMVSVLPWAILAEVYGTGKLQSFVTDVAPANGG